MSETSRGEFFRHLRPTWFSLRRGEILTHAKGGISFMLVPVAEQEYDFWVNICPMDALFSAKHAVVTLRRIKQEGIAPTGRIKLDGAPIVDQLVKFVVSNYPSPYELGKLVEFIALTNNMANRNKQRVGQPSAIKDYQNA